VEPTTTQPAAPESAGERDGRGEPRGTGISSTAPAAFPGDDPREKLLGFAVHEIRNPLASGLWAVEMLARHAGDDPRAGRLSKLAARSVRRLRALVEDWFAMERLPARPPPGRAALRETIARVLAPSEFEPAGLAALVEDGEAVVVPLDPATVEKLLRACVRRALRAGEGGEVSIRVAREDGTARVDVVRAGATAAMLDPGPFVPGGSEGEGTTLALYVARTAAARLGVGLEVVDEPAGAVIRLRLPAEP